MRVQQAHQLTDGCPTDSVRLAAQHCCRTGNVLNSRIEPANHVLIRQHGRHLVELGMELGIVEQRRE